MSKVENYTQQDELILLMKTETREFNQWLK